MFPPETDDMDEMEMKKKELADLLAFAKRGAMGEMRARHGKPPMVEEGEEMPEEMAAEGEEAIPGVEEEAGEGEKAGGLKDIDPEVLRQILAQLKGA